MKEQMAMDKQVEEHLDEIRADLQAKRQGIQKTSLEEKAVHKIIKCQDLMGSFQS